MRSAVLLPLDSERDPLRSTKQLDAAEQQDDVLLCHPLAGRNIDGPAQTSHTVGACSKLVRPPGEAATHPGVCVRLQRRVHERVPPVGIEVPPAGEECGEYRDGPPGGVQTGSLLRGQRQSHHGHGAAVLDTIERVTALAGGHQLPDTLHQPDLERQERQHRAGREVIGGAAGGACVFCAGDGAELRVVGDAEGLAAGVQAAHAEKVEQKLGHGGEHVGQHGVGEGGGGERCGKHAGQAPDQGHTLRKVAPFWHPVARPEKEEKRGQCGGQRPGVLVRGQAAGECEHVQREAGED
eukprot:scaffold17174_cov107-Isochrysis_galbana.AAC.4